ncbi:MAG: hypothetical protein ACK55O_10385 [Phycisphaerales bacterium]
MTTPSARHPTSSSHVTPRTHAGVRPGHRARRRARRRVALSTRIARRLLRAAAMLGIQLPPRDPLGSPPPGADPASGPVADAGPSLPDRVARDLDDHALPGVITLLSGPSGVGKSRTLRALHARLRARRHRVAIVHMLRPSRDRRPLACASSERLDRWLAQLARAGLADAALLPVRARDLSDGQHARLLVARAMLRLAPSPPARHAARPIDSQPSPLPPPTLIIDEYASTLDLLTARLLTISLSRWARRSGVRIIVASARDELVPALRRDLAAAHLHVRMLSHAGLISAEPQQFAAEINP